MPLFELHAHTSECDIAAHATAAELVRLYHAAGYDGMVITDHYFAQFYKWFADELVGRSHREIMANFQNNCSHQIRGKGIRYCGKIGLRSGLGLL